MQNQSVWTVLQDRRSVPANFYVLCILFLIDTVRLEYFLFDLPTHRFAPVLYLGNRYVRNTDFCDDLFLCQVHVKSEFFEIELVHCRKFF